MLSQLLILPFLLTIIILVIVWIIRAQRKKDEQYATTESKNIFIKPKASTNSRKFFTEWRFPFENKIYDKKEFIPIILKKKRYLTGNLQAKYWAQNEDQFFAGNYEQTHDITIYEVELSTNVENFKNDDKQAVLEKKYDTIQTDFISELPRPLKTTISQNEESGLFLLDYGGIKVYDFFIGKIQDEGKESFGTITGMFIGYVIEEIPVWIPVEGIGERVQEYSAPDEYITAYPRITGKKETQAFGNAIFMRNEIETAQNVFTWSKWEKIKDIRPPKADSWTNSFFSFFLIGLFFILLFAAWKVVAAIIIAGLIILLFSGAFHFITRLLQYTFSLFFIGMLLSTIIGLFNHSNLLGHKKTQADAPKELTETRIKRITNNDTLISNFRSWNDYHGHHYQGYLSVSESAVKNSRMYVAEYASRQNQDEAGYHTFCGDIVIHDSMDLKYTYAFFDSLKSANNLNRDLFAETIITCIQDIPYVLITNGPCNADYYPAGFVKSYLQGGGDCEGSVPFGLFSPVEFTANLQGDCDTRTIFAYTILKHYKYDVIVLSSVFYSHSIIGIAFDNAPAYKTTRYPTKPIAGISVAKYFLCELTAYGPQPGKISESMNDLSKWNVELK